MMDKLSKVLSSLVLAGSILALTSGLAQAATWLTEPILGYNSSYTGDVIINSGPVPTNIPHSFLPSGPDPSGHVPLDGVAGSPSMSVFTVGQQVHTGSGIFLDAGARYSWTGVFTQLTGGSASFSYAGSFLSDGFWMTWNSPTAFGSGADGGGVPTLTMADVGDWQYVESYTGPGITTAGFSSTTPFTVAIPEPEIYAMMALGLGLLGWVGRRRKLQAA